MSQEISFQVVILLSSYLNALRAIENRLQQLQVITRVFQCLPHTDECIFTKRNTVPSCFQSQHYFVRISVTSDRCKNVTLSTVLLCMLLAAFGGVNLVPRTLKSFSRSWLRYFRYRKTALFDYKNKSSNNEGQTVIWFQATDNFLFEIRLSS